MESENLNLNFENQIINIKKPLGWSSFDVVAKFRSKYKLKKVGHAGTLDPLATGVLLLATGTATKQISTIQELEKEYQATFVLGVTTASLDTEFFPLEFQDTRKIDPELIQKIIRDKFIGEIQQYPPAYSAIKINGQRAYSLARSGADFEDQIAAKSVRIKSFDVSDFELLKPEVLPYNAPNLRQYQKGINTLQTIDWQKLPKRIKMLSFRTTIVCSKGTYIRSLVKDLAANLHTTGYILELKRTRIGDYLISDSLEI